MGYWPIKRTQSHKRKPAKFPDPKRMVKALALRVGLSVALFVMLMAGYYFGLIPGRL